MRGERLLVSIIGDSKLADKSHVNLRRGERRATECAPYPRNADRAGSPLRAEGSQPQWKKG